MLPTGTGRKERGVVGLSRPDSLDITLDVRRFGAVCCAAAWACDRQRLRHDVNTCHRDTDKMLLRLPIARVEGRVRKLGGGTRGREGAFLDESTDMEGEGSPTVLRLALFHCH